MRWCSKLYTGPKVRDEALSIRKDMEQGVFPEGIYLITFCSNGSDLMDIREARQAGRPVVRENLPGIIGLARGKKEAFELAGRIACECLAERGDLRIDLFLEKDRK